MDRSKALGMDDCLIESPRPGCESGDVSFTAWVGYTRGYSKSLALAQWGSLFSQEDFERIGEFVSGPAVVNHIIGRVLLRNLLSAICSDIKPEQWRFGLSNRGKPHIISPSYGQQIKFSIAHCDGAVVVVATTQGECGVDIERIRPMSDYQNIAMRVLSDEERLELEGFTKLEAAHRFLQIWTLKEAYGKALGVGLTYPLTEHSFNLVGSEWAFLSKQKEISELGWTFQRWAPDQDVIVSFAFLPHAKPRLSPVLDVIDLANL
jgi:4'-phosphopantetheinyl transferase